MNPPKKSKCCNAGVMEVRGTYDTDSYWYECLRCDQPCDLLDFPENT